MGDKYGRRRGRHRIAACLAGTLLMAVAVASGCSTDSPAPTASETASSQTAGDSSAKGTETAAGSASHPAPAAGGGAAADGAGAPASKDKPAPAGSASPSSPAAPVAKPPDTEQIQAGQLTAGEWNDLREWDGWLNVLNQPEYSPYLQRWRMKPQQRLTVKVTSGGAPSADAAVTLYVEGSQERIWQARTNNLGEAELFVQAYGSQAKGSYSVAVDDGRSSKVVKEVKLEYRTQLPVEMDTKALPDSAEETKVDVMFVIDTTGSMADELKYLTAELASVVSRVREASGQRTLDLRLSTNVYRDQGDDYVVRPQPFTGDIQSSVLQLSRQAAMGGGDYEEAVDTALEDALGKHEWSSRARARLLFLVLDAPPHNREAVITRMQELTAKAAAMGVRIIPVASSGVDKNTEFLMRSMAVLSGGTYSFLTNHSGIGGSHIAPTAGEYKVEFLNDLLVRVISEYVR